MSALGRKLIRDVRQNWHMLLAVSAIIAVGIGCFIGMLSAARNLEIARTDYYSTTRLADFWVDLKKAPIQDVRRLANIPGISEIRERIQFPVVLDFPNSIKPVGAMLLSLPDTQAQVINNIILRKGTYFTPGRANEVIVAEKFAEARGIEPGMTITAVLNNQKKDLIVVGTAISAEFVYMASPGSMVDEPGDYGLMFIKRSFAEDVFGFQNACNSIVGFLAPEAKKDAKRIVEALADNLATYGVFAALPRAEQFSPMVLDSEMSQLEEMAYIFPVVFLIVASLVLNVLMIRLAEQQRTVIGTLKAIGYENRELMIHFIQFATTTGVGGGLLGCFLGYLIGYSTTSLYVELFTFPALTSKVYPDLFVIGITISVMFSILGTVKGIRQIMRLEPAEAMRQAAPPVGEAVFLEWFTVFWKRLDAQWQMILRGLLRNKSRTLIAIFSATMGSSIVVLAFGFVDSVDQMVDLQFGKMLRSDYHVTFRDEMGSSALDEVQRLKGVTLAEPVLNVACTFISGNKSKRGAIMGIVQGSVLTSPLDESSQPISVSPAGLLMSKRLMDQLGVQAGDYLNVEPVKGLKHPRRLPVAQGIESMLGLMVYADYTWLNHALGEQGAINEVRIRADQTDAGKNRLMAAVKRMPGLEALTDINQQEAALRKQMDGAMRGMAVIMIAFAAVIFFGAILNGTLISISERKREMATFRTMGYFDYEVGRLFLRENLLTNITGTLAGLPLGYWMLETSIKGFSSDAYSFPAALSWMSCLYTLVLAILFVLISQIFVRRNLTKQNWVEALSLKE